MKIGIDITEIGRKAEDIDLNALVSGLKKEVTKLIGTTGQVPKVTLDDFNDIEIEAQVENLPEIIIEEDTTPTIPRFSREKMLEMVWEELNHSGDNATKDVHDAIMADIKRDNPYLIDKYLFMGEGVITIAEVNEAFAKIHSTLGITQSALMHRHEGHDGGNMKQLALFMPAPLTWEEFKALL